MNVSIYIAIKQYTKQLIIDELSKSSSTPLSKSLEWFIGSGVDNETLKAIDEEEKIQKKLSKKKLENDN